MTTKVTQIDRATLRTLQTEIDAALARIAAEHGLDIRVASGSFTSTSATLKVVVATKGEQGEVKTPEASYLEAMGRYLGLAGVTPGTKVIMQGEEFEVTGFNRKAPKAPVGLRRTRDGKAFKTTVAQVTAALG